MGALEIWRECIRQGVALSLNGDRLHYSGPPDRIEALLAAMKEHRDGLIDCVRHLGGTLLADGYYLPWGPYLNAETLQRWQRDLFEVVDELARLEGWPADTYDLVVGAIERQPISTLRPDLHHFRERRDRARAAAATGRQREPR